MARHRINENGHMMWFDTDEEYYQYLKRKSLPGVIGFIVLGIIYLFSSLGHGDKKEEQHEEVEKEQISDQKLTDDNATTYHSTSDNFVDATTNTNLVESASDIVVIDDPEVLLLISPSMNSGALKWKGGAYCHPEVGEKFECLAEYGDYYQIEYRGYKVWVLKQMSHVETPFDSEMTYNGLEDPVDEEVGEDAREELFDNNQEETIPLDNSEEDEATEVEEVDYSRQKVFTIAEEMPSFSGGDAKLMEYIAQNICYPRDALENSIQGRVFVNFIVEPNGSVSNVKVLKGIGSGCDEEAMRVIKDMPKWNPGKHRGKIVRVECTVPVSFRPQ